MDAIHLWSIVFLLLAGQGLLLTVLLLLSGKWRYTPNRYLAAFLLVQTILVLLCVGFWNGLHYQWVHLNYSMAPWLFLPGVLLLGYFRALAGRKWTWKFALHFVPFLLTLMALIPFYGLSAGEKIDFFRNGLHQQPWRIAMYRGIEALQLFLLTAYSGYFLYGLKKSHEITGHWASRLATPERKWMGRLAALFAVYVASFYLYYFLIGLLGWPTVVDYLIVLAGAVMIFTIGWMGFNRPELFRFQELEAIKKYQLSSLTPFEAKAMEKKLLTHFEQEKPYLDEHFSLDAMARQTAIPRHHLSELLNQYMDTSFAAFVNGYRVAFAQRLIEQGTARQLTLEAIAFQSGFSNRNTFYKAFKKKVGLTPSMYRKQYFNVKEASKS